MTIPPTGLLWARDLCGSAQLTGEAPGLQIRCGALKPSRVGSIPMHFRHFLFYFSKLIVTKPSEYYQQTTKNTRGMLPTFPLPSAYISGAGHFLDLVVTGSRSLCQPAYRRCLPANRQRESMPSPRPRIQTHYGRVVLLSQWNDVLQKNPFSSRAMINLGTAYLHNEQLQRARALFIRATDLKPESGALEQSWNFIWTAGKVRPRPGNVSKGIVAGPVAC